MANIPNMTSYPNKTQTFLHSHQQKSPEQRPQHRGQVVFGSCHAECHIPHGATQIHLDARVQHDALGRLYQHHVHTQRALVAGGKML